LSMRVHRGSPGDVFEAPSSRMPDEPVDSN
jgi:hypothetical protein